MAVEENGKINDLGTWGWTYLLQDFLPDVVTPVGCDHCEELGLEFHVLADCVMVHSDRS